MKDNKNNTFEHLENTVNLQEFVDNISQVSKSFKDGKLSVDNLEVKKELIAPNIKTYQVNSTNKDNWIDFHGKTVFYEDAFAKKNVEAPNIKTYQVNSTHKDKWIDFKGKPVFYEDVKFSDDKHSLTATNITTKYISSTGKDGNYVDIKSGLYSPNDNLLGTIKSGYEPSKRSKVIIDTDIEYNKSKYVDLPDKVKFKGREIKQNSGLMTGKKNWIGY